MAQTPIGKVLAGYRVPQQGEVLTLVAVCTIGSSGAVTQKAWNLLTQAYVTTTAGAEGILSVTKESTAGMYTFVLNENYRRLLGARVTTSNATGISAAPDFGIVSGSTDVTSVSSPQVQVQMSSGGSATNPASGDTLIFEFIVQVNA